MPNSSNAGRHSTFSSNNTSSPFGIGVTNIEEYLNTRNRSRLSNTSKGNIPSPPLTSSIMKILNFFKFFNSIGNLYPMSVHDRLRNSKLINLPISMGRFSICRLCDRSNTFSLAMYWRFENSAMRLFPRTHRVKRFGQTVACHVPSTSTTEILSTTFDLSGSISNASPSTTTFSMFPSWSRPNHSAISRITSCILISGCHE